MLHNKFPGNWSIGSREAELKNLFYIYGRGGHLGHVTSNMLINFNSTVPKILITQFGLKWPSGF